MHEEIVVAGFGGQGVIMAGKLLCLAAMKEGKHVSHIPSYGAEMRGGTANCSVVISDDPIGSPVVPHPTIVVAMNGPSMRKFEPRLKKGGLLLYNSSLIDFKPERDDIEVIAVKANDIAEDEGSKMAANMAAIGRLQAAKPDLVSLDNIIDALKIAVSKRNQKHNEVNIKVLKKANSSTT